MKMLIGLLVVVLAAVTTEAALPRTESFKSHLHGLESEGNKLQQCLLKVTNPLTVAANFAGDVKHIMDLINNLEGRVSSIIAIGNVVMLIPGVDVIVSPVLVPALAITNTIDSGLKTVAHEVGSVANVIIDWLNPIRAVKSKVSTVLGKIIQMPGIIRKAEVETTKMENCVEHLPQVIKPGAESALENVAGSLDPIPTRVKGAVRFVEQGCHQVEGFLHNIHLARRKKRSFPSLHNIVSNLEHIESSLGDVGKFLDQVHKLLNNKICLVDGLFKFLGKTIGDIGKGAEHLVNQVGHAVDQVGQAATHAANQVGHAVDQVGQAATHAANQVGSAVNQVGKGVEHAGQQVAHAAAHITHQVSSFVSHIFGRRSEIDGQYYVLVDADYNVRKRSGIDLCFSVKDILNVVSGVTGGMLNEATKLISSLVHSKSIFNIPGLTDNFLHLSGLLRGLNVHIPSSVAHLLHLDSPDVYKMLHLDPISRYLKAVPACKASLNDVVG